MHAVLLGSKGGPRIVADRCGPGALVDHEGHTVLVDSGEGVVQQIVRSGRSLAELDDVFITHHHCDHNVALGNVLMGYWASGAQREITVHGPPPIERIVQNLLAAHEYDIDTRVADEGRVDLRELVRVDTIEPGDCRPLAVGPIAVSPAPVEHPPVAALGYRFAGAAGSPSIVVSGDTAPCQSLIDLAHGTDVLIHEVLHPDFVRPMDSMPSNTRWSDLERHLLTSHTSVHDLGSIAAAAGAATLVLSHLVPATAGTPEQWLDPIRARFDGRVLIGRDLMSIYPANTLEQTS